MPIRESSYGYWSGTGAFVIVAAVSCIGIGSITRLPSLAMAHGGGAFLICYLAALAVLGWPLLHAELLLGRWCRRSLVPGFERVTVASGARSPWRVIGWMMLLGAALVLSYTSVIAGWSLAYVMRSAAGSVAGQSGAELQAIFHYLARDPERSLTWHTMFMLMSCIVVSHGVRDGIERGGRYLMALATACLVGLLWFALQRGNVGLGLERLLVPDFSSFGWRGLIEAVHMAFFTVSVGFGVMFALGGYVTAQSRLSTLSTWVVGLTAGVSLIGGLAVASLLPAGGAAVPSGLALIFQAFPASLAPGLPGILPGILFYGLLSCVALASAIALLEAITLEVMERMRTTRVFAATTSAVLVWLLGVGSLLSFNVLSDWAPFGRTLFGWVQWLTVTLLAPGAALLLCTFVVRIMPAGLREEAWGSNSATARRCWEWMLRFPVRVLLIVLLLHGFGVIDSVVGLWN